MNPNEPESRGGLPSILRAIGVLAVLSLALIDYRVGETPTRVAVVQMVALLLTGPAVGFGIWAWGNPVGTNNAWD